MNDLAKKFILFIFFTFNIIVCNERQFMLEKQMYCPCKKGILYDHDSRSADQLKKLISVLIKNPISYIEIQGVLLKEYKSSESLSNCLAEKYNDYRSKNYLQDNEIFEIISNCYGKDLIRNEDPTILYFITFMILTVGFLLALFFIKKSRDI